LWTGVGLDSVWDGSVVNYAGCGVDLRATTRLGLFSGPDQVDVYGRGWYCHMRILARSYAWQKKLPDRPKGHLVEDKL